MPGATLGLRRFMATAAVLLAGFFIDAASGRVLSQADILYRHAPWSASAPPGFTGPGNPLLVDIPLVFYPFLKTAGESLRAGRLPVWNQAMYAGQPFLASFQSALFSPFIVFAVALPPADAMLATAAAKLLAGAAGMFVFLRRLGLTAPAVWCGALAFLFNPFSVVWLEHPPSAVALWLPWLLWSVERLRQSRATRDVALLSALVGTTLLAGHPETGYKVLLLAGAYAAASCVLGGERRFMPLVLFGQFLPAALLGLCLSAVQVVPFLEYLSESGISAMRRTFETSPFAAPAQTVVTAFVPAFFGNPSRGPVTVAVPNRHGVLANYCAQQIYPGNATWILAAVAAAAGWRHWRVGFFGAVAVVATLVFYGVPGASEIFAAIPVGGLAAPTGFALLTITAIIILAAHGMDAVAASGRLDGRAGTRAVRASLVAVAVMSLAVVLTAWWAWPLLRGAAIVKEVAGATVWGFALALASVVIVMLRASKVLGVAGAASALLALVVVDLFAAGFRFHPMIPRSQVYPPLPAIAAIRADRGIFRVAGFGDSLPPNTAMAYGLEDARGYDGVAPRRYCDLLGRAFGAAMLHRIDAGDALQVLDLLNVKYLFAGRDDVVPPGRFTPVAVGPSRLFRNEDVFPRAFLVGRVRTLEEADVLDFITGPRADLRHEAVLAERLDADAAPEPADPEAPGTAAIVRYESTRVEVATESAGRRLLVLSDAYYPGWTASIDGRAAPIHRAYHALRAVTVPAGRHTVRFEYEARVVWLGAALSGVALCALGALVARDRRALVEELKACTGRG